MMLETKPNIPAVKAELAYIAEIQEAIFWDGIDLNGLEELRLRLRGLVHLLDKKERKVVYTNFKDDIEGVWSEHLIDIPKMTGAQYEKKVKDYLRNHQDQLVIHRLRTNQPLTETDLQGLESALAKIGEEDGRELLSGMLTRSGSPSLAYFVRSLVGMDRTAAQGAFSEFLSDRSLTPQQIRFVEMVIDQLTARGIMDASALYEPPFSNLHSGGPDELFAGRENVIEGIFEALKTVNSGVVARAG